MADVDCSGFITSPRSAPVAVLNTAQTEGSEEEVLVDSNVYGAADGLGTFVSQVGGGSWVCNGGIVQSENQTTFAYIRSQGLIKICIQGGSTARSTLGSTVAPYPKQLLAGDQLIVMANTATDRECALVVATNRGDYHIFATTPSGAADNQLRSILTTNTIGATLQGQTVTHAFFVSEGGEEIISAGGCYILDGSGTPVGCVPATNSNKSTPPWRTMAVPITLNTTAVVKTDA